MTTGAKLTVILAVALVLLAVVYFLVFVPQGDLPIRAVDPQMSEGQVQDAAILGTDATLLENSRAVPAAAVIPPATPILATLMPPTVALATVGGPSSNVTWQIVSSAENDEEPASELEYYATSRVSETTGGRVSAVVSNPGASIEISNTAVTGRLYTINPGDTLSDISLAWFGTSLRWQDILDANPGLNPKRMRVGHRITLPAKLQPASPGRRVASAPPKGDLPGIYTVRSGDSLTTIAQYKLGSMRQWRLLWEMNRDVIGSDPDNLKVGMHLKLRR